MAYVGSLNIVMIYFTLFYPIVDVGNYLENRIDPIGIIINNSDHL